MPSSTISTRTLFYIVDNPTIIVMIWKFLYSGCCRLQKVVENRPNYIQLLEHPFISKYDTATVDMASFVSDILDKHMPQS